MRFKNENNDYVTVNSMGIVFKNGKIFMQFENEYDAIEWLKDSGYEEAGYAG